MAAEETTNPGRAQEAENARYPHLQVIFRVEVAQLHPAEELAEGEVSVPVGVAQLEVPSQLVLGFLPSLPDDIFLMKGDRRAPILKLRSVSASVLFSPLQSIKPYKHHANNNNNDTPAHPAKS